jgi:hypothetical protein
MSQQDALPPSAAFSLTSDTADGSHYVFAGMLTGPNSAGINVTEWAAGTDPNADPATLNNAYVITGMRQTANNISGNTEVWFMTLAVSVNVGPESMTFNVGPESMTFPISVADSATLTAWMLNFTET